MADATDLKSVDRKVVWVRLPPSAPITSILWQECCAVNEIRYGVSVRCVLNFVQIVEEDFDLHSFEPAPLNRFSSVLNVSQGAERFSAVSKLVPLRSCLTGQRLQ